MCIVQGGSVWQKGFAGDMNHSAPAYVLIKPEIPLQPDSQSHEVLYSDIVLYSPSCTTKHVFFAA